MENTLKLKDFVREALIEINEGVIAAMEEGVSITHKSYGPHGHQKLYPKSQEVSFDLSVSVGKENGEQKEKSAGMAISVISGKVGKERSSTQSETVENRITFTVEAFLGKKIIEND